MWQRLEEGKPKNNRFGLTNRVKDNRKNNVIYRKNKKRFTHFLGNSIIKFNLITLIF